MRSYPALAAALALAFAAAPAQAGYGSGTSSTGNVDTWNLPNPWIPPCQLKPLEPDCLVPVCPQYFAYREVVLRLIDPSPFDVVSLEAFGGQAVMGVPVDVATYDDPEAAVPFRIAGCYPGITAVVTGILVDGEVEYEVFLRDWDPLSLGALCVGC